MSYLILAAATCSFCLCGSTSNTTEAWLEGDQSKLFQAVVEGEVEQLRALLDTGVDASLVDSEVSVKTDWCA